jgi:3-dehydroquinate dehydratase / shikimate dehydrogenase
MNDVAFQTERLLLRQWKQSDLAVFAKMNADPKVMEFFPALLTETESNALAERIQARIAEAGFGLWAVEIPGLASFIGYVGLSMPRFDAHFTPCVEIGWRLAFDHWGKGYASEAARTVLRHGIEQLELSEIVSFTSTGNQRSRAVMERIGMAYSPDDDFDHPSLSTDHPLCRHVLYRYFRGRCPQ